MDDGLSAAVTKLFVKMYNEGLIYREKRLVNWCPKQMTSVSDLEVETREEHGKFYYFNYPLVGGGVVEIATTRPETLFGDQAIAIHPENEKLKHLIGRRAIIPLTDIEIPIIADVHADPDKGTGAVKITPAHDFDDWDTLQAKYLSMTLSTLPAPSESAHAVLFTDMTDNIAIRNAVNELAERYKGYSAIFYTSNFIS